MSFLPAHKDDTAYNAVYKFATIEGRIEERASGRTRDQLEGGPAASSASRIASKAA
jgi:ethanolamine ammonia-lyase large subunit